MVVVGTWFPFFLPDQQVQIGRRTPRKVRPLPPFFFTTIRDEFRHDALLHVPRDRLFFVPGEHDILLFSLGVGARVPPIIEGLREL